MFITYLALTLLAAAANVFSATPDFIRFKQILVNMWVVRCLSFVEI